MSGPDSNLGFSRKGNNRDCNREIMPGYAVLAVDSRLPEYPEGVVVERADDAHPLHTAGHERLGRLLQDRYYVRFSRLLFESRAREEPEVIERGADLEDLLKLFTERRIPVEECCEAGLDMAHKLASAMLQDYRSDRLAYVHLMN